MEDRQTVSPNTISLTTGDARQLLIRFQIKDDQDAAELLRHFSHELYMVSVETMKKDACFALAWFRNRIAP